VLAVWAETVINWKCGNKKMTITLNLKPELEAGLLAQARAVGATPDDCVRNRVERDLSAESSTAVHRRERA